MLSGLRLLALAGLREVMAEMKIVYDPSVDALTIRFIEERVQCEVIRLNDQVAVDIGPGERIVALEVLDASELIPGLKDRGVSLENLVTSCTDAGQAVHPASYRDKLNELRQANKPNEPNSTNVRTKSIILVYTTGGGLI